MASREPNALCERCGKPYWVARYKLEQSRYCCRSCKAGVSGKGIDVATLRRLYCDELRSMQEIADALRCSLTKSKHGTLSLVFCNIKLKKIISGWCAEYQARFSKFDS
jgi:hypothetical protein